jgi:hypothetical protein
VPTAPVLGPNEFYSNKKRIRKVNYSPVTVLTVEIEVKPPHYVSELLKYVNNYSESQFVYFRLKNYSDLICFNYISNSNSAEKRSPLIHAGGGGQLAPSPFSPVIAVIEGQTKRKMIMIFKKAKIKQLLTVFTVI